MKKIFEREIVITIAAVVLGVGSMITSDGESGVGWAAFLILVAWKWV